MIVADGLDQQAGFGIAGDDDRTVDAAFQEFLLGIHDQGAPDFGGSGAVALVTMLCQNWTDTVLEKLETGGCGTSGEQRRSCEYNGEL